VSEAAGALAPAECHFHLLLKRVISMQRLGIILGVVVAICWGSADTVATVAARRQGPLMTTLISLVVSASVLLLSGVLIFGQFFGNSTALFASIPSAS
jgi:hypothetical protein